MAICKYCKREMSETNSCDRVPIKVNGEVYQPIKYGQENGYDFGIKNKNILPRCPVCNVTIGSYHHPGCTMERCPICDMPITICGCIVEEWEEDDEQIKENSKT